MPRCRLLAALRFLSSGRCPRPPPPPSRRSISPYHDSQCEQHVWGTQLMAGLGSPPLSAGSAPVAPGATLKIFRHLPYRARLPAIQPVQPPFSQPAQRTALRQRHHLATAAPKLLIQLLQLSPYESGLFGSQNNAIKINKRIYSDRWLAFARGEPIWWSWIICVWILHL